MDLPLISIIIPVYNAEKYLKRCLNSVCSQHYKNLEVILIDDGSTDSSPEICDQFANNGIIGITIRVFHQKNSGASIARKKGINAASGEYITFIDADDFISSYYVLALYEAVIKHRTAISVCKYEVGFNGSDFKFCEDLGSRILEEEELFKRFFKYEFWGYPGAIYKKALFDSIDFPIATLNEDYYVKTQLFIKEPTIAVVESPLYYYEKHAGSLSNIQISERGLGEFDNAFDAWLFIQANNCKYSQSSLAIVSEVATKWLNAINFKKTREDYIIYYQCKIRNFIIDNLRQILLNPCLSWKIKISMLIVLVRSY